MSPRHDPSGSLEDFNTNAWATGGYVDDYSGTDVQPAEAALIARHASSLGGRTLELGCGAGRLTRVLVALSDEVEALDVSPGMVEACRRNVPRAAVTLGDLRDLGARASGSVDAVVAANNLLDVLGDQARRRALEQLADLLVPGGVLLMSAHNRAHIPHMDTSAGVLDRSALQSPRGLVRAVWRMRLVPARTRNRRLARPFERSEPGYQVVNDPAHAHRFAHYYIGRDAQERQFADAGFTLEDCLDHEAVDVPAGAEPAGSTSLHFAARR